MLWILLLRTKIHGTAHRPSPTKDSFVYCGGLARSRQTTCQSPGRPGQSSYLVGVVITPPYRTPEIDTINKIPALSSGDFVVPLTGLEPVRSCPQRILSPRCLPFHHSGVYLIILPRHAKIVKWGTAHRPFPTFISAAYPETPRTSPGIPPGSHHYIMYRRTSPGTSFRSFGR